MAIKIDEYSISFSLYEKERKEEKVALRDSYGDPTGETAIQRLPRTVLRDSKGRRLVRCQIIDTTHGVPIASGTAVCSEDDPFVAETGRLVALRKATANKLLIPKTLRSKIFQAYLARGKK